MRQTQHHRRGFTLIEAVIYIAIFTIIIAMTTAFFLSTFRSAARLRADGAVITNIVVALKAIELEIRHADAVYTPTSAFDSNAGQLSLRTPRLAPQDHPFAYVDFYLDHGVLYEKRDDSSDAIPLTSGDVTVSVFRIERYASGNAEGIRLTVTAQPSGIPAPNAQPRTFHVFVPLRPFTP
jgi:type II secretory pathway component PulJ